MWVGPWQDLHLKEGLDWQQVVLCMGGQQGLSQGWAGACGEGCMEGASSVRLREQNPDLPGASADLYVLLLSWISACHLLIAWQTFWSLLPCSHTPQEPEQGLSF